MLDLEKLAIVGAESLWQYTTHGWLKQYQFELTWNDFCSKCNFVDVVTKNPFSVDSMHITYSRGFHTLYLNLILHTTSHSYLMLWLRNQLEHIQVGSGYKHRQVFNSAPIAYKCQAFDKHWSAYHNLSHQLITWAN